MPNYIQDPMGSSPNDQNWWDTLKGAGNTALWVLDRPQQAIFQGARRGSQDFERSMHQGQDPFSSAISSLPSMVTGMWSGLTGEGPDVRGRDLTSGLNQFHEWVPEDYIGTTLDITASPTDIAMPIGRLSKMALIKKLQGNQYRKAMDFIGRGILNSVGGTAREINRPWGRTVYTPTGQYLMEAKKAAESTSGIAPSAYKYVDYDFINKIPTSPFGIGRRSLTTQSEESALPSGNIYSKSGESPPSWWKPRPQEPATYAGGYNDPWKY